jgi:uncharacterized C2H2 Zn-finger protein
MKDKTNRIGEDIYKTQFMYKGFLYKNVSRYMIVGLDDDRNECPTCDKLFKSVKAFDKHRTGEYGVNRRCLTEEEMLAKGMSKNRRGFWITQSFDVDAYGTKG